MKKIFKQKNQEPSIDVILKLLELAHEKRPEAAFISSLLMQYRERGGLSKKQMEGLHSKTSKIEGIPPQYLATLQAIILKKYSNHKSVATAPATPPKDDEDEPMVKSILAAFPEHKRVLFFQAKLHNRLPLTPPEKDELKKFYKLLIK